MILCADNGGRSRPPGGDFPPGKCGKRDGLLLGVENQQVNRERTPTDGKFPQSNRPAATRAA
jgi:hypothetical protein